MAGVYGIERRRAASSGIERQVEQNSGAGKGANQGGEGVRGEG